MPQPARCKHDGFVVNDQPKIWQPNGLPPEKTAPYYRHGPATICEGCASAKSHAAALAALVEVGKALDKRSKNYRRLTEADMNKEGSATPAQVQNRLEIAKIMADEAGGCAEDVKQLIAQLLARWKAK